jgi:hypothetical protein
MSFQPGSHTNVHIRKKFHTYEPYPFSECRDLSTFEFDRTLFNVLVNSSLTYTQRYCFDLCMQQEIIFKCKCYYLEFSMLNHTYPCLSYDELECVNEVYNLFLEKETTLACLSQCPLEYDSMSYESSISTVSYPSDSYIDILKTVKIVSNHYRTTPTNEQLRQDVLSLSVFFNENTYVHTIQSRKLTEIDLFAIIGGTLSLCFGFSLVSAVQIFDLIFEIIMILIGRDKSYFKMKEEPNNKIINEEFNEKSLNINVVDRNMFCKYLPETNQIDRIIAEGCRSYLTKTIMPNTN